MMELHTALERVYARCSEETIPLEYAEALHRTVRRSRPRETGAQDRYFVKVADFVPRWDFYAPF
jgi:hypothetical protein